MSSPLNGQQNAVEQDSDPESPGSPNSTASTPSPLLESPPSVAPSNSQSAQPPSQFTSNMTTSSTPLGNVNAARRPPAPQATMSNRGALPQDLQARMKAFHLGRQGTPAASARSPQPQTTQPPPPSQNIPAPTQGVGGVPASFGAASRPGVPASNSSPAVPGSSGPKKSLAEKRNMALPGGLPGAARPAGAGPAARKGPGLKLSDMAGGSGPSDSGAQDMGTNSSSATGSLMDKYSDFIDKNTGALKFKGKATLTPQGVRFEDSGSTFNISLDEVDTLDELGKGNYGTVYKVRHSRPRMRRPGLGLAGNKQSGPAPLASQMSSGTTDPSELMAATKDGTSGVVMAMKEIRLELDDSKFAAIIMELDILHRCISPFIVDFYGAFFQEGAVYICMEFMDGGSIDKLYGDGIPEPILRKITLSTTMGLKSLKDDHNIIHRDVKPTNILVNSKGQIKICDFGVSGNLVASIAKTNIGCQSYMAPERIKSGGVAQAGAGPAGGTYSVQSDIWSLGLTIIECALGQYPYPPETYDNIFSQLSAIVDGDPPDLPSESFSDAAHDFVRGCLNKIPRLRPTYQLLLQHAWLAPLLKPPTISEEDEEAAEMSQQTSTGANELTSSTADREVAQWMAEALERRRNGTMGKKAKPALHAAPLDAVPSPA
ncbi:MAG: hypothetical protein Q9162_002803 [Coniocarpon cinnabarinum]